MSWLELFVSITNIREYISFLRLKYLQCGVRLTVNKRSKSNGYNQ